MILGKVKNIKKKIVNWYYDIHNSEDYCRIFHTAYNDKDKPGYWHCPKCNISYKKRLSDDDSFPI